jgi:methionyl-tRNA formyltransferase
MLIQILCDNPNSWIIPYALQLKSILIKQHEVIFTHNHGDVIAGDVLMLLSCEKLFKQLNLNKNNLVVHESDLPKGKGWSPLTWQIIEGKNEIPVTLIEATEQVDAGDIYGQEIIVLKGTELVDGLREKQGEATIKLLLNFIENYPNNERKKQEGEESFYPRRKSEHNQLDIHKTIAEQFNLLRVCDNERYPAWFEIHREKFIIKIEKIIQ